VWTKGHEKLGAGVTQESHKKLQYKFPMGNQGPSKHRGGKVDRDKQAAGPERECVNKSMSAISGKERKEDLTS
jgi:hypothetical protein